MNHILAIVEREMRKFFRSPALMMASMIFPLVQLIVLGNAFGGKIRDARLGLVDQDGGTRNHCPGCVNCRPRHGRSHHLSWKSEWHGKLNYH